MVHASRPVDGDVTLLRVDQLGTVQTGSSAQLVVLPETVECGTVVDAQVETFGDVHNLLVWLVGSECLSSAHQEVDLVLAMEAGHL